MPCHCMILVRNADQSKCTERFSSVAIAHQICINYDLFSLVFFFIVMFSLDIYERISYRFHIALLIQYASFNTLNHRLFNGLKFIVPQFRFHIVLNSLPMQWIVYQYHMWLRITVLKSTAHVQSKKNNSSVRKSHICIEHFAGLLFYTYI